MRTRAQRGRHRRAVRISRGLALRAGVLAIAGIALVLAGTSAPALADGPATYSNQYPTAGALLVDTPKPTVTVRATDPAGIVSATINIDGSSWGYASFYYPIGHWEDDGCDMWWVVDDYSVMEIRRLPYVSSPSLSTGSHTVNVTVTNNLGQVSTYSWSFTSEYTPVITAVTPAAGQVVNTRVPTISATVSDASASVSGVMTVNGVAVSPTFDSVTKTFSYVPSPPLDDGGLYTVAFTATDSAGLSASRTWSFEVAATTATVFRTPVPAPGSTITALPLAVSIRADDPYTALDNQDQFNTLLVDGIVRPTVRSYPIGHWESDGCEMYYAVDDYTVMDLSATGIQLTDGPHVASARVRTTSLVTSETAWDFYVSVPPVVSDPVPALGTSSRTPTISVRVSDNSPGPYGVTMTVNGSVVPVVVDPGTGVASYTPTEPLPDGQQTTVVVEAADVIGNTTPYSWSFLVDAAAPATFSSRAPAPGSTINLASTSITAQASSSYQLVRTSVRAWLDGVAKTASGSQISPTQVGISAATGAMVDGLHTARVQVTDVNGVASESEWTFNVAVPPTGVGFTPGHLTTATVPRPPIGLSISDNTPGPLNVRLSVNGVVVMNEMKPQGIVRWTPTSDLANGGTYIIAATITDAVGASRTYNWRFYVSAPPPMSDGNQCGTCHPASEHAFSPCSGCHQDYPGYDPHVSNPAAPLGECTGCHGDGLWHNESYVSNCAWCHSGGWSHIPGPHTAAELDAPHLSVTPGCTNCHDGELVSLHGLYPGGTDFKYQCATCHASARTEVRAAVAAEDTRCTSCHDAAGHGPLHDSALAARCTDCHDANVSSEHADACALCHDSADPVVSGAIAAGDLSCETCHGFADHYVLHEGGFSEGDGRCGECHSANISDEHLVNRGLSCEVCHGVAAPAGVAAVAGPGPSRGTEPSGGIGVADVGADPEEVWEAMESGDTSCFACHTSFHGSIIPSDTVNPAVPGYLSWDAAQAADPASNSGSPHGGYTASTNKCAVCHSAHRATAGGSVLTAYGPYATYAAGCIACHGPSATFTDVRVTANADGYISPHGTCTRCHAANPHGLGASAYATLAAKLINTSADGAIAADLSGGANGLVPSYFDGTVSQEATGTTLGTGYLCSVCHLQAFAVNVYGADPAGGGAVTGHRVLADATSSWDPGAAGASMSATSTIAYADARGCDSCHAAQAADGQSAFPHGYVDGTGAVAPKTVAGASYLWLTTGSYAGAADTTMLATTEPDSPVLLTEDGLCLKCHRAAPDTGVGRSY